MIHCIDPLNRPSQAVALRLGSRKLGVGALPAPYDSPPIEIWGQSAEAWRARSR